MSVELKAGYKQTVVGVIPEDWDVKPLWSLAEKIMVGIASAATHAYRNRGIVMFRNQNIKPGYLDDSDILYIAEDYEEAFKNKRLKSGDLLTARTGYPGTTSIVPARYDGAQSFTTLITRPRKNAVDSGYLCCFINSEAGQLFFDQNQIGGGQKNVNAGSLKLLPVPLPATVVEQEAIAEALSDADALIESLNQLITKKRHLKHGAMQELLTGKRRLPGFSGEWEVKRLGSLGDFFSGGTPNTAIAEFYGGDISWITSSDCNSGRVASVEGRLTKAGVENSATQWIKPGTVLVALYGATAGVVAISEIDATINQAVLAINLNGGSPEFLFQKLAALKEWIIATFTQGGQPNLSGSIVKSIEIPMPAPAEQTAIASILSDMDTELAELESRLAKARQIKQGMMQELLTGRIRLL